MIWNGRYKAIKGQGTNPSQLLALIMYWGPIALEPPSKITLDSGIRDNYAGSAEARLQGEIELRIQEKSNPRDQFKPFLGCD